MGGARLCLFRIYRKSFMRLQNFAKILDRMINWLIWKKSILSVERHRKIGIVPSNNVE